MAVATARQLSSWVWSSSCRPGTPPVWKEPAGGQGAAQGEEEVATMHVEVREKPKQVAQVTAGRAGR